MIEKFIYLRSKLINWEVVFNDIAKIFWNYLIEFDKSNLYNLNISNNKLISLTNFFWPLWRDYIFQKEVDFVKKFDLDKSINKNLLNQEWYFWDISYELKLIPLKENIKKWVLLWSWPYPETLFWLIDYFPKVNEWILIDVNQESINYSKWIIKKIYKWNTKIIYINDYAEKINYWNYDFVFMTNWLKFKKEILDQIYNSCNDIIILLRNPIWAWVMIYEEVISVINSNKYEIKDRIQSSTLWETLLINPKKNKTQNNFKIINLFQDNVKFNSYKIAIIEWKWTNKITYSELNEKSIKIANWITTNVHKNWPIAFCLDKSINTIALIIWIIRAGKAYVPLDPTFPKDRLSYIQKDVNACIYIYDKKYEDKLIVDRDKKILFDTILEFKNTKIQELSNFKNFNQEIYILYTSWSTWRPKWIKMSESCLYNLIKWQIKESWKNLKKINITSQFASLNFDVSFQEIFSTLCTWWTLVLIDDNEKKSPLKLAKILSDNKVNRLFIPYFWLELLCWVLVKKNINSLKEIITAWEVLKISPIIKSFFLKNKRCILWNQYWPTETHVASAYKILWKNICYEKSLPSIWKPITNWIIYVLDNNMNQVEIWEIWEIYIWWLTISNWYISNNLTNNSFIIDPFIEKGFIYKTWDLWSLDEQWLLYYHWRTDRQVKIQWYRIEIQEIESVILECKNVTHCAVLSKNDNDIITLNAFIEVDNNITEELIIDEIKYKLPEYMIPNTFNFISNFPLTQTWKVDYKALESYNINYKNDIEEQNISLENMIENEWNLILWKITDKNANFFELWWNSLLAMQFVLKIEKHIWKKLSPILIFEYPSLSEIINYVKKI